MLQDPVAITDGDWMCHNCRRADRVALRCRAANASYYLFCNACAIVVDDHVTDAVMRRAEGWTSSLTKLLYPGARTETAARDSCLCSCHHPIFDNPCAHCVDHTSCTQFNKAWCDRMGRARASK